MQTGDKENLEILLIKITNTVLEQYYGGASSRKKKEYAREFDRLYRSLHRTVTTARRMVYRGIPGFDVLEEDG